MEVQQTGLTSTPPGAQATTTVSIFDTQIPLKSKLEDTDALAKPRSVRRQCTGIAARQVNLQKDPGSGSTEDADGRRRRGTWFNTNAKRRVRRVSAMYKEADEPEVHVLMICLNYEGRNYLNVTSTDAVRFARLCNEARASSVTCLVHGQDAELPQGVEDGGEPTIDNVDAAIRRVASRPSKSGFFILFFAGHGTQVKDLDGDESDGYDEAIRLCDGDMTDDQISDAISETVKVRSRESENGQCAKVMIITDCCHSASIGDIKSSKWDGIRAVSLAGAQDHQCSIDTGKGGNLTNLMCESIESFCEKGITRWSVSRLWSEMVGMTAYVDKRGSSADQCQMNLSCTAAVNPVHFLWPLTMKAKGHNYVGQDYTGRNYTGHDSIGAFLMAARPGAGLPRRHPGRCGRERPSRIRLQGRSSLQYAMAVRR